MLCSCSNQFKFDEKGSVSVVELGSRQRSSKIKEGEAKLDEGNIEEAETSLREALSLNNERLSRPVFESWLVNGVLGEMQEARALLGRLEYQRGNVEGALQAFEGIDLTILVSRMRFFASEKVRYKKGKPSKEALASFLHAASLLLEAIYLKAKSLQKLGRLPEAAQDCKNVLDTMEAAMPGGMPSAWGDTKVAEIVGKAVQLLPQLLLQAGLTVDSMSAYRRALLSTWHLDVESRARMQKEFAVLLLYGGVEASSPSFGSQVDGAYVPKNNIEEAILLLMLLLCSKNARQSAFDASVLDHLSFALSVSGQCTELAHQYEELLPGILSRSERWYNMALCYSGAADNVVALDLLCKSLSQVETPNDVPSLLLAAKICAGKVEFASKGAGFAQRAVDLAQEELAFLKSSALHVLGVALSAQTKVASSDSERMKLQQDALQALQEAAALDSEDPKVIFDLGMEYAEQRQLSAALDCAKLSLDRSGGACLQGWRFLALLLTAQERHSEAELVLEGALEETGPWEQGPLLRTQAKVQLALGQPLRAIHTYHLLLALVQAERKSFEAGGWQRKQLTERVEEVEVWQDLVRVYTELQQWSDAEICLEKARALETFSATTWHATGLLHEVRGQPEEAMACYKNALAVDAAHVDSKVKLGALLRQQSNRQSLPVARSYLSKAVQAEPTHEEAWYQMGLLHKAEGHASQAADCFQAAVLLDQCLPVEKFSSITRALLW